MNVCYCLGRKNGEVLFPLYVEEWGGVIYSVDGGVGRCYFIYGWKSGEVIFLIWVEEWRVLFLLWVEEWRGDISYMDGRVER